jgi:hypothetical protein
MKASVCECEQPAFKPFCIKIEVQSYQEACQLYGLFNHGWVMDGLPAINGSAVRDAIVEGNGHLIPAYMDAFVSMEKVMKTRTGAR